MVPSTSNTLATKESASFSDFLSSNTDGLLEDTNSRKPAETANVRVLEGQKPSPARELQLSLDDLDRMAAGGDDDWAQVDQWLTP